MFTTGVVAAVTFATNRRMASRDVNRFPPIFMVSRTIPRIPRNAKRYPVEIWGDPGNVLTAEANGKRCSSSKLAIITPWKLELMQFMELYRTTPRTKSGGKRIRIEQTNKVPSPKSERELRQLVPKTGGEPV